MSTVAARDVVSRGSTGPTMHTIHSYRVIAIIALTGALIGSASALGETHSAFWRSQELELVYRSRVTQYECRSLERKVGKILAVLGAHPSTRIELVSCHAPRVDATAHQLAVMHITLVSPAPATPEARAEINATASRAALLDRLGVARPSTDEFAAQWLELDVARIRRLRLDHGDCELLSQLGKQVLSHLALQSLDYDHTCSSSASRVRRPKLKAVALLPLQPIGPRQLMSRDR